MEARRPPHSIQPESIPSKYFKAIRTRLNRPEEIHTDRGRAIVLGSDIFYSPNSSHVPQLPSNDGQPFQRIASRDDVDEIQQPLWWTREMAYLPFVPKVPNFDIIPFDQLHSDSMSVKRSKKLSRHQVNSEHVPRWTAVENTLHDTFKYFRSAYGIPEMKSVVSTAVALTSGYKYKSQHMAAENRCRKWFATWMGLVSFAIAVAQTYDNEHDATPVPQWIHGLLRFFEPHVAAGIRQELASFSPLCPRAGVFLKIMGDTFQHPVIDFFVRWNIPIWYPWGEREEYHLRLSSGSWESWKPPSHLLQVAKSFLVAEPSLVTGPLVLSNEKPGWKTFIESRKRQSLQLEKSGAKAVKVPKKVFVWEEEDGKWKRVAVYKRDYDVTLAAYGVAQKYYDKLTNEWDCCSAMGNKTVEELQEDAWSDEDDFLIDMPSVPNPAKSCSSLNRASLREPHFSNEMPGPPSFSPASAPTSQISSIDNGTPLRQYSNLSEQVKGTKACKQPVSLHPPTAALPSSQNVFTKPLPEEKYDPETYSPENTLYLLHGFTYPTSKSTLRLPQYSQAEEFNAVRTVCGAPSIPDDYFNSTTGQAAIDFVKYLLQPGASPRNELYDLACSNHRSVRRMWRFHRIHRLPGDLFVLKLGDRATAPWSLAVKGAGLALSVVCLDEDWNDYRLAFELLNRGVQFYTLRLTPESVLAGSEFLACYIPRTRLSSSVFSEGDYELYKQERAKLMCIPRVGRASLKKGGIIWRLSIELNVSFSEVLAGPTADATLNANGEVFNPGDTQRWIDDKLQDSEMDIICGVYKVYTGLGVQQASVSWWPTAALWEELTFFSAWNDRLEGFYLNRLKELESGSARPRCASEWRKTIRAHSILRRAVTASAKAASNYLSSEDSGK